MDAPRTAPSGSPAAATLATLVFAIGVVPAFAPLAYFFMEAVGRMWGGESPRWALPFIHNYALFGGVGAAIELLLVRFAVAHWAKRMPEGAPRSPLAVAVGAYAGAVLALALLVLATHGNVVNALSDGLFFPTGLGVLALIWIGAFAGTRVRARTGRWFDFGALAAVAVATAFLLPPALVFLGRLAPF